MKNLKKEFMGKSADFIFRAIINNPFIKLEGQKFDLISISTFRDDFAIGKTEAGYKFESRFAKEVESTEEYRQEFRNFIDVAKGSVSKLVVTIKSKKTEKEVKLEVDFSAYVLHLRINSLRNRCFENGCETLSTLSDELLYRLSGAMIGNEELKKVESAYLKMNEFSRNRHTSNICFYSTRMTFEFDNKDYEIDFLTQEVKEI